jgi:hypothetical protein
MYNDSPKHSMSCRITTLLLGLVLASCATPTAPTQQSAAPAVCFPDLKEMAGTYTLTIDLDESCTAMPAAARRRVYHATLEDRGWHFLVVNIDGGGRNPSTIWGALKGCLHLSGQRRSRPLQGRASVLLRAHYDSDFRAASVVSANASQAKKQKAAIPRLRPS